MPRTETHGPNSLSMASEDYLESFYRIMVEQDAFETGVRSVDVAEQLEVSKASVNKAISTLREAGYVEQTRYGRVMLTEEGASYAADVWRCHRMLRTFLEHDLGVEPETADAEACLMEHALSHDTMVRWMDYLKDRGHELPE